MSAKILLPSRRRLEVAWIAGIRGIRPFMLGHSPYAIWLHVWPLGFLWNYRAPPLNQPTVNTDKT